MNKFILHLLLYLIPISVYSQEVHGISMQEIDYQGDVYYYQGQYNSRKGAYDSDCSNLYVGTKFINYNSIPVNVEITIHKPFDIKYHEQEYGLEVLSEFQAIL